MNANIIMTYVSMKHLLVTDNKSDPQLQLGNY